MPIIFPATVRAAAVTAILMCWFGTDVGLLQRAAAAEGYALSDKEQKLNCQQLSGRIQVNLLAVRDYGERPTSSSFSRGFQGTLSKAFGTTAKGVDPDGDNAEEVARLYAYNRRLSDLGCKSYNIEEELKSRDPHRIPAQTVPPPQGRAKHK